MFDAARGSASAVEEEAITNATAAVHSERACGLLRIVTVTVPVRSRACNSCVPFHGDSQIARDPTADRRGRRGGRASRLALGADWRRHARVDVHALGPG